MTQADERKMQNLERDVKRLEEENAKRGQRICEANKRNEEQWKTVQSTLSANTRLEQDLSATQKELKHAHCALKLYKAAASVMTEAGYEAARCKEG